MTGPEFTAKFKVGALTAHQNTEEFDIKGYGDCSICTIPEGKIFHIGGKFLVNNVFSLRFKGVEQYSNGTYSEGKFKFKSKYRAGGLNQRYIRPHKECQHRFSRLLTALLTRFDGLTPSI